MRLLSLLPNFGLRFTSNVFFMSIMETIACLPNAPHNYLLTPWSRILLEKLTGSQLVKKFPAFYGTCRFFTALTSAVFLSWVKKVSSGPRILWMVRNMIHFYDKEFLAPRPTPKQEDQPLSAVRDCLFNIFAATIHIGGRSSIPNLRTRSAVVTSFHTGNNNQLIRLVINTAQTRRRCKSRPVSVYVPPFFEYSSKPLSDFTA